MRSFWRAEWPRKDVHAPIPGTWEYVTFHGKRDFGDMIKVMGLEMGRLSWIRI